MNDSARITVKLTPNASKNAVVGWAKDAEGHDVLRCSVTSVPEKGKANKALILLLSKHWRLPKSAFTIIRGETDRTKIIKISGFDPEKFV